MKGKYIVFFLILISIVFGLYYCFNTNHRDICSEESAFRVTVNKLQQDFNQNDSLSNEKYLDKTISVKGKITEIDAINHSVALDNKLWAVFKDSLNSNLKMQQEVTIKGRFIGYDDLLEEFRLDQTTFIK